MLARLLAASGGLARPAGGAGRPAGWPLADVHDPFALEVHRPAEPDVWHPGLPALPVYVHREHDAVLAEVASAAAAGASGIAVLVGGASTGKTRASWQALELLRRLEPGWRLWYPIDPQGALAELPSVQPRTVVWLNEAQRYLDTSDGAGERVAAGLRELLRDRARGPVLVLAMLWPEFWNELTGRPPAGADLHAQARELLAGHDIPVPPAFTKEQLRELEAVGDPRLAQAVAASRDGRVIQYLAEAPKLLDRYRNAPPAARALMYAAMDAHRLGMKGALPQAFLAAAAPGYLTDADWDLLPDDWLEEALAYMGVRGPLTPHRPRPSPPGPDSPGGGLAWQLADYLDQHGRRARRELIPPTSFWDAAASYAGPAGLDSLGEAAEDRGLFRNAALLYKQASARGNPRAAVRLVRLLYILHPGDQRPADWAAAHVSLDHPAAVACLLDALRDVGATGQVATLLARDPAAHASLDHPSGVADLLSRLRDVGATGQVATLLARDPAAHASLDHPSGVAGLLGALHKVGADTQVTTLASRAAAEASLDDPAAVAELLGALRDVGATGQVATLLDRDPAARASLDHPSGVAGLLGALHKVGADTQVTTLASRAAAEASLDDPNVVDRLADALREVGAMAQAVELIGRLPAPGQYLLFWMKEQLEGQFRFGREADGSPAGRWAWIDLG